MATTTNYSWTTPDDTDLVKDGAAAIRSLGTAIDSTVFTNAGNAINKTIVDAKGDIIAATAADTVSRLAVGANNTVLTADSTEATGLKWASPNVAENYSLLNAGGTALTGAQSVSVTGISNMNKLFILVKEASSANASAYIEIRVNSDTTAANYKIYGWYLTSSTPEGETNESAGAFPIGRMSNNAGSTVSGGVQLSGCNSAGNKMAFMSGSGSPSGGSGQWTQNATGVYLGTSTISSVQVRSSTGNLDGGTVFIYGSA